MSRALRIAVADDEPDVRDYFRRLLPRLGHQVVAVAQTGRELVEQCRAARRDAGADPGPGRADAAWACRLGAGPAAGSAEALGGPRPRGPRDPALEREGPSLPFNSPETNSRGRRTPPPLNHGG